MIGTLAEYLVINTRKSVACNGASVVVGIGCSSQLVPIYNHSEFDVPVMIEIDHGFTMTIQGHITNKIRIRAKTHVMCSIAPYNGAGS